MKLLGAPPEEDTLGGTLEVPVAILAAAVATGLDAGDAEMPRC